METVREQSDRKPACTLHRSGLSGEMGQDRPQCVSWSDRWSEALDETLTQMSLLILLESEVLQKNGLVGAAEL